MTRRNSPPNRRSPRGEALLRCLSSQANENAT